MCLPPPGARATASNDVSNTEVAPGYNLDLRLWFLTQLIDYAFALAMMYSITMYGITTETMPDRPAYWALVLVVNGHLAAGLLYIRERLHFRLLGRRASRFKVKELGCTTSIWYHVFQTVMFSQTSSFFLGIQGLLRLESTVEWSLSGWANAYLQFYLLLVMRDWLSLTPFHAMMHRPRWYHLHKTHHSARKETQAMHAFHIDLLDLLIENTGAPVCLYLGQYLFGQPVGLHFVAGSLLTMHDAGLHSVNPYSAMYFFPPLDHVVKGNVCHQLHHALNDGYIRFVPYAHLWSSSRRRKDAERYNTTFETDFALN